MPTHDDRDEQADARLRAWADWARRTAPQIGPSDLVRTEHHPAARRWGMIALAAAAVMAIAVLVPVLGTDVGGPGRLTAAPNTPTVPSSPADTSYGSAPVSTRTAGIGAIGSAPRGQSTAMSSRSVATSRTAPVNGPILSGTASAPTGDVSVTFHGLTVTVPSNWTIYQANTCGTAGEYLVVPAAAYAGCAAALPEHAMATFSDGSPQPLGALGSQTATSISGLPAIRQVWNAEPDTQISVTVPSLQASIIVTGPTSAEVDQIIDSLRAVATDVNGCASRIVTVPSLTSGAAPQRPGAADQLIPSGPTGLRVCRYVAGWLEQGATIPVGRIPAVVSALDAVPSGLSQYTATKTEAAYCRPADSLGIVTDNQVDNQVREDSESYQVIATYASGPAVTVTARIAYCGILGASNGTRTAQRTDALLTELTTLAGSSTLWPQAVTPVG